MVRARYRPPLHQLFALKHNLDGSLAQSVEQLTFNQLVAGSNPARLTTDPPRIQFFRVVSSVGRAVDF